MKRKKKVSKASKRRLLIFGTISAAVIVYFFVTLAVYTVKIYNLKVEEKNVKSTLNELHGNEDNLKTEIEKLKNEEYLAKYARENYQYSKDGELVIHRDEKNKKKTKQEKMISINTNYILYGGVGIIILIFIYILKRKK